MTELASASQLRASFLRWALVCVPGVVLLGLLSGNLFQSGPGNPWFDALTKPSLYPPPATFGIVWTVLYVLMGIALALVASARGAWGRETAFAAFIIQLLLNLAWTPLFFAANQITWALILLCVLIVAAGITVWLFHRVRPLAAWLMLPYLAWLLFAAALNWQFLEANPGADGKPATGASQRITL